MGQKTRTGAYVIGATSASDSTPRRAVGHVAMPDVWLWRSVAAIGVRPRRRRQDTTPPIVKLEIKQGQHFNAVKTATMNSGEPLTVRAVVRDPQGVKSLTVSFPPATADTCTSAGTIFNGSFPIALPPKKVRSTTGLHTKLVTSVDDPIPRLPRRRWLVTP